MYVYFMLVLLVVLIVLVVVCVVACFVVFVCLCKFFVAGEPNMSLLDSSIVFGAEFSTEEAQSTQNC